MVDTRSCVYVCVCAYAINTDIDIGTDTEIDTDIDTDIDMADTHQLLLGAELVETRLPHHFAQ